MWTKAIISFYYQWCSNSCIYLPCLYHWSIIPNTIHCTSSLAPILHHYLSSQSDNPTCKTNRPPHPEHQSTIPTCITYLTSQIPFIILAVLCYHFATTYLHNLITLKTNQPPLAENQSNIPNCIINLTSLLLSLIYHKSAAVVLMHCS